MGIRRRSLLPSLVLTGRTHVVHELPNGIRVVVEHIPSAYSVVLGVWVNVGSRDEEPQHNGIAHFVEHLVAGSSHQHSAYRLAVAFEELGTEVNAFTTKEVACYSLQTLRPYLPRVLSLLSEQLMAPRLTRRAIERERRVILEELLSYADDPEEALYEHAEKLLFGEHPLGMPIAGTAETLQHLTRDDLAAFHSRFYVGERMVITLVGNVSAEEAIALLAETFGQIPRQREALPPRFPPVVGNVCEETLRRPLHQAYVLVARLLPKLSPAERMALTVLNFLLGEGWSSRLYQRIRERHGLVYSIASELEWFSDCALWSISASARPSALTRVERLIGEELQRLSESGISEAEFLRGRNFLQARLAMALDNPAECMTLLVRAATDNDSHPLLHAFQELAELEREQLNALAAQYCAPEQWSRLRLLPDGAL